MSILNLGGKIPQLTMKKKKSKSSKEKKKEKELIMYKV